MRPPGHDAEGGGRPTVAHHGTSPQRLVAGVDRVEPAGPVPLLILGPGVVVPGVKEIVLHLFRQGGPVVGRGREAHGQQHVPSPGGVARVLIVHGLAQDGVQAFHVLVVNGKPSHHDLHGEIHTPGGRVIGPLPEGAVPVGVPVACQVRVEGVRRDLLVTAGPPAGPAHLHGNVAFPTLVRRRVPDEQHVLDPQGTVVLDQPLPDLLGPPVGGLPREAAEIRLRDHPHRMPACLLVRNEGRKGLAAGHGGVARDDHVVADPGGGVHTTGLRVGSTARDAVPGHAGHPSVHDRVLRAGRIPARLDCGLVAERNPHAPGQPQFPGKGVVLERVESHPREIPLPQLRIRQEFHGGPGEEGATAVYLRVPPAGEGSRARSPALDQLPVSGGRVRFLGCQVVAAGQKLDLGVLDPQLQGLPVNARRNEDLEDPGGNRRISGHPTVPVAAHVDPVVSVRVLLDPVG